MTEGGNSHSDFVPKKRMENWLVVSDTAYATECEQRENGKFLSYWNVKDSVSTEYKLWSV